MATAVFEVRVEPLGGALPVVTWRLDEETEILAGGFKVPSRGQPGVSASVELTDPEGAIVVLDIHSGRLTGLDIVIWPALELHAAMTPPVPTRDAEILLAGPPAPADSTRRSNSKRGCPPRSTAPARCSPGPRRHRRSRRCGSATISWSTSIPASASPASGCSIFPTRSQSLDENEL
jgi:hypothetical protein